MLRKVFWLLGILMAITTVSTIIDRREAARRRELWSEATDPH